MIRRPPRTTRTDTLFPSASLVLSERQRHDVVEILGRRPAEGRDVLFRDHRVAQVVRLVIVLDDRPRQWRPLGDAEALREAARGDVPDDHLDRDDLHLVRSEEHTSELQSLMRISYAVFCLHKKIT